VRWSWHRGCGRAQHATHPLRQAIDDEGLLIDGQEGMLPPTENRYRDSAIDHLNRACFKADTIAHEGSGEG